jgi:hypothetical protein
VSVSHPDGSEFGTSGRCAPSIKTRAREGKEDVARRGRRHRSREEGMIPTACVSHSAMILTISVMPPTLDSVARM